MPCQLLPSQIPVRTHGSSPLPTAPPLSIHSSILLSHIGFPLSIISRTMPTHSTFQLLYLLKSFQLRLNPDVWYVSADTLPISTSNLARLLGHFFSQKLIFVSQFSFQFQTVSFLIPIYQCTSKMSHIIPSTDPNVSVSSCLILGSNLSVHFENVTHHSISQSQSDHSHVLRTPT